MCVLGASTGALARQDWRVGFDAALRAGVQAVELSALRFPELKPLVQGIELIKPALDRLRFVSVHAPSRLAPGDENEVLALLDEVVEHGFWIIAHPDAIPTPKLWRRFGRSLCIENMDKRKPVGRTVEELTEVFAALPDASLCFDFAHARQIDPSMSQAMRMLGRFGGKLVEIHLSDLDAASHHRRLNAPSISAFQRLVPLCHACKAVIIESPVSEAELSEELRIAAELFQIPEVHGWSSYAVGCCDAEAASVAI